MFDQVMPEGVAFVSAREDVLDVPLFPEEEAVVENAVEKRRREFVTGRACARAALIRLGLPEQAIPQGIQGAPLWPEGVVGSITHCNGFRACAVAHASDLTALGIDAEPNGSLPGQLIGDIALPHERQLLDALSWQDPSVCWDRLLFCAKETTYKAWFPLTERWLGFEDAMVALDPGGTFSSRLLVRGPRVHGRELTGFSGRWVLYDGILFSAIALENHNSQGFGK